MNLNFNNEEKNKVVFLDRDGTINQEVNYLYKTEDFKFLPYVKEALALLKKEGFKLIVITNQAGVARGYYKEEDVKKLHEYVNELLKEYNVQIDAFYYCPHHPEHGIGKYKVSCHCRKPEIGMFEEAEKLFAIDKERSYMIGDKLIDVEAGHRYGVKSILVGTGYGKKVNEEYSGEEAPYEFYGETLLEAAKWICAQEK